MNEGTKSYESPQILKHMDEPNPIMAQFREIRAIWDRRDLMQNEHRKAIRRALRAPLTRQRKREEQRACRARKREEREVEPAASATLKPQVLSRQAMHHEMVLFRDWLCIAGHRQRQFRPHQKLYLAARLVLLVTRHELGADPGPTNFGRRLASALGKSIDRRQAHNLLRQLRSLEEAGGPWSA